MCPPQPSGAAAVRDAWVFGGSSECPNSPEPIRSAERCRLTDGLDRAAGCITWSAHSHAGRSEEPDQNDPRLAPACSCPDLDAVPLTKLSPLGLPYSPLVAVAILLSLSAAEIHRLSPLVALEAWSRAEDAPGGPYVPQSKLVTPTPMTSRAGRVQFDADSGSVCEASASAVVPPEIWKAVCAWKRKVGSDTS